MRESGLWARIKRNVEFAGDFVRIENSAGVGQPDVNYCINGREGWIELKYKTELPSRATSKVFGLDGLRAAQVVWIRRRLKHGGRCCIIAQAGSRVWVIPGEYAPVFNDLTEAQLDQAAVVSGGRIFDWSALLDYLKEKHRD